MPVEIFVKSLTGKTITLSCELTDTVLSIKEKFHNIEGVPVDEQRLIFGGKQMDNAETLESYGVQAEATLFVVLRLRGGSICCSPVNPFNTLLNINLIMAILSNGIHKQHKQKNVIQNLMFDDYKYVRHSKRNGVKHYKFPSKHNIGRKYLQD